MISKSYNMTIQCRTPVHIGNGNSLCQDIDYVQRDGYIYYLSSNSYEKIFNTISNEQQREFFLEKELTLNELISQQNISLEELAYRKISAHGVDRLLQINQFTNAYGSPYIPGSTVKGAIRSQLGRIFIEGLMKDEHTYTLYDFYNTTYRKLRDRDSFDKLIFGPISKDIFRGLHVGDTNLINSQHISLDYIERYNFKKNTQMTSNIYECLEKDTVGKGRIKIVQSPTNEAEAIRNMHNGLSDLDQEYKSSFYKQIVQPDGFEKCMRRIHDISLCRLKEELRYYKSHVVHNCRMRTLIDNQELLLDKMLKLDDAILIRIGFGKSHHDLSYDSIFDMKKIYRTKSYITQDKTPSFTLGWVTIQLAQKEAKDEHIRN